MPRSHLTTTRPRSTSTPWSPTPPRASPPPPTRRRSRPCGSTCLGARRRSSSLCASWARYRRTSGGRGAELNRARRGLEELRRAAVGRAGGRRARAAAAHRPRRRHPAGRAPPARPRAPDRADAARHPGRVRRLRLRDRGRARGRHGALQLRRPEPRADASVAAGHRHLLHLAGRRAAHAHLAGADPHDGGTAAAGVMATAGRCYRRDTPTPPTPPCSRRSRASSSTAASPSRT